MPSVADSLPSEWAGGPRYQRDARGRISRDNRGRITAYLEPEHADAVWLAMVAEVQRRSDDEERRALLAVMACTIGCGRLHGEASRDRLMRHAGLHPHDQHWRRALRPLKAEGLVRQVPGGTRRRPDGTVERYLSQWLIVPPANWWVEYGGHLWWRDDTDPEDLPDPGDPAGPPPGDPAGPPPGDPAGPPPGDPAGPPPGDPAGPPPGDPAGPVETEGSGVRWEVSDRGPEPQGPYPPAARTGVLADAADADVSPGACLDDEAAALAAVAAHEVDPLEGLLASHRARGSR